MYLSGFERIVTPKQILFKTTSELTTRNNRTGLTAFDSYLEGYGIRQIKPMAGMPTGRYFVVDLDSEPDWDSILNSKPSFSGIEYFEPNYLRAMHVTPNDPLYPLQLFPLSSIQEAWDYSTGSPLIVVGVVDSGILREHPDLIANLYINPNEAMDGTDTDGNGYIDDWCGWDFVHAPEMSDLGLGDFLEPDNDVTDENFHGTHVAGIVGAAGNNGIGVTGVCWNVRIMPLRAGFRTTTGSGYLQDDDAAAAIIYAADNGCNVINMSWGDPNYSAIIADACQYAYDRGVVLVASAGNDAGPTLNYPAKLSTVISVGAINKYRALAGFSSYGSDLDLVAPGEQILSTYKLTANEMYYEMNGTSMSAPHVTGSVALLLGLQPGLSPEEVRARLLSTTDDLGDPGFDIRYGHGLLNTRRLLESFNPPMIEITSPGEQMGCLASFDITGTVTGSDFFRYCVMYTDVANPSALDWKDVQTHNNSPIFYHQQVENNIIARFNISPEFAEGRYLIRIQYQNIQRKVYNHYRTINYDKTAPVLIAPSLLGFKRYDGSDLKYYISAKFNEKVMGELKIKDANGEIHFSYGTLTDSLQVWHLPPGLPQGNISIWIIAVNNSALVYESNEFPNFMNIQYDYIPTHGFSFSQVGAPRVPLRKTLDFHGNGSADYIAMELPASGYGKLGIYEPGIAGHSKLHEYPNPAYPLDVGKTTAPGNEIMYLIGDNAYLIDTPADSLYPGEQIWTETGISGGIFANYQQGISNGLLLVKNLPTQRVIQAYQRTNASTVVARNMLINNTTTFLRNTFVPTILVDNFDGDSSPDILTADTDGDIMMFEIYNQQDQPMTWNSRLPVGNAYQLTKGDYTGDGSKNFFVGGYNRDNLNPHMNFWYFEGFRSSGNDSYTSMGSIMFNNVASQNAIHSYDLDNDGKDEIILALSPNLYVLKYINGKFTPIYKGESYRTYDIAAWRDTDNNAYFLTNYQTQPDTTVAVEWKVDAPFTGPATPINFIATPYNENTAVLSWIDHGSGSYRIHRKNSADLIEVIENVVGNQYWDADLSPNQIYQYAITRIDLSFDPTESLPTPWKTVTLMPKPSITALEMIGSHELRITFNQRMASDVLNPGCYLVSHGMEHPHSVNSVLDQHGVQLRFRDPFPEITEPFVLDLRNIRSISGVEADVLTYTFSYVQDTEAPRILSCSIKPDMKSVEILLSEDVRSADASQLSNYSLVSHANDPENQIVSASSIGNSIVIALKNKLRFSNQNYKIVLNNIHDFAGNVISPIHNIASFGRSEFTNLESIVVYPNPVKTLIHEKVYFLNFPNGKTGHLAIFNSSGDIIYDTEIGPFNEVKRSVNWDLRNSSGAKVSSGIYYYVIRMGDDSKKGKIAIIR